MTIMMIHIKVVLFNRKTSGPYYKNGKGRPSASGQHCGKTVRAVRATSSDDVSAQEFPPLLDELNISGAGNALPCAVTLLNATLEEMKITNPKSKEGSTHGTVGIQTQVIDVSGSSFVLL